MTNKQTQTDVIVIGGGLAGLTAATFLACAGQKVTLFEKSPRLGGRAETQVKNGYHFNLGPHALYRGGAGVKILRELEIEFAGGLPPYQGYVISNGVTYTLPSNQSSLFSTKLLNWLDKFEAARVMASLGKIDPQPLQRITLRDWLNNNVRRPQVRALLQGIFRVSTYAYDIDRHSAGAVIEQVQVAMNGNVYYLDNGWQTLVDALRQAVVAAGGKIVSGAKVQTVEWDDTTGVKGIRLADGAFIPSANVLITGSPAAACELVERNGSSLLQQWAESAKPIMAACLDVALKTLPQPKARFAFGMDRPLYFSVHSAVARLAPSGGALIHMAKYLNPAEAANSQADEAELERVLDLLQPGWRDVVVERRFLPQMVVSNALVTAAQGGTAGRPGPAVPDIPGLYVAGDWVGREGMLSDASFASAKQAAKMILTSKRKPVPMDTQEFHPVGRRNPMKVMGV